MTTNALLIYLGVALVFPAVIFFVLGTQRSRKRPTLSPRGNVEAAGYDPAALVVRQANFLCGAMLLIVALVAAAIGIARGGPAAGEPDGNTGKGGKCYGSKSSSQDSERGMTTKRFFLSSQDPTSFDGG